MTTPVTERDRAKEERRRALTDAAARLFASEGFAAVSMSDLGSAAGISGPAVYRHFTGKQALLDHLLVSVSKDLVTGGAAVIRDVPDATEALERLVDFHVRFALEGADIIRVQDRELSAASDDARRDVRRLQSAYAADWIDVLGRVRADLGGDERRLRVHACFGLINSTPHSLRAARALSRAATEAALRRMAVAALLA